MHPQISCDVFGKRALSLFRVKEVRVCQTTKDFNEALKDLVLETKIPSMAAGIVGENIHWLGAFGKRFKQGKAQVTLTDKYHLGSCGKSFTSLFVALLVKRGLLSWETTLSEVLSGDSSESVLSVANLLSHTAGLPRDLPHIDEVYSCKLSNRDAVEYRLDVASKVLLEHASETCMEKPYAYSNLGYILLGSIIDQTFKEPFEAVIQRELAQSVKLPSLGFGMPQAFDLQELKQPIGHPEKEDFAYSGYKDNHPVLSPAGRMHLSVSDTARYLKFLICPPIEYKKSVDVLLQGLPGKGLPMGWHRKHSESHHVDVLWHTGTNTFFFSAFYLVPEHDTGAFVMTNSATDEAAYACRDMLNKLLTTANLPNM